MQSRRLKLEYGGVSELCWISPDLVAVGTTRGYIVTFSIHNEALRLVMDHNVLPCWTHA